MKYDISEFEFRRLEAKDVDSVMALQDTVYDELADKNLLRKNTREMFALCIDEPNISIGVYHNNMMIAVGIMVDARGTDEDLGIGLEKYTVDKNANMKNIMVISQYRGNGLQGILMRRLEQLAVERGYTDLCASISPQNSFSLNNALALGYKVDHLATKYGGLERAIVVKKLI